MKLEIVYFHNGKDFEISISIYLLEDIRWNMDN